MGFVCDCLRLFGVAEWYHRHAVSLAQQVQHSQALGDSRLGVSFHEFFAREQLAAARAAGRDAGTAYATAGDLREWGLVTTWEGYLSYYAGDLTRLKDAGDQLTQLGEDAADRLIEGLGHGLLGIFNRMAGNLDEAVEHLCRSNELLRAVPYYSGIVWQAGELGACYLHRGELPEAIAILEDAGAIIRDRRLWGAYARQLCATWPKLTF